MRRTIFMTIILLLAVVVFGGIVYFEQALKPKFIKAYISSLPAQVQTVTAMSAPVQSWQPQIKAIGSLRAVDGADLSLEVSGIIDEIDFKSGDDVKAGTTLLHLRSDEDVAKLQSLTASAELAQVVYDRDKRQLSAQAVSQATVDSDSANLKNAKAQVAAQQAAVDQKTLTAPFAGKVGIRTVDLGQYVNAGTTIVTLQNLDQLYLDFVLPEQEISQIAVGQKLTVSVDTYPGKTFPAQITAIEPRVDATSRNISVLATLANPDSKLLPGMFATAEINSGNPQQLVTVPQTAIVYNSFGDAVYLVVSQKNAKGDDELVARQNFVTLGDTRGDQVAVLTGVKQGDQVVTSGQLKLQNGALVKIDNSVQPSFDANPTVKDP